jgi:4-amino-4-deoxy-L-arabinose transferase-like glycosyltransferase
MPILVATLPRFFAALRSPQVRASAASLSVLAIAALLFFGRLGERALWSMELRWSEIPREMALNGDYFQPTINGHLYYDKPLGSYWLVLAASRLTGTLDEATARLPSAVAGWLGVVLIIDLGRRLFDRRTGVLAGLVLATSFGYIGFARTASADAETVVGTLAALALFMRNEDRLGGSWVDGLWAIMAVTSLTKGLLGFVLPLVVLFADAALGGVAPLRDRLRWLLDRRSIVAAGLAVAIYITPFALSGSGAGQGLFMVFRENVRRFFDPVNHRGPAYLYLYVILGLFAPWSLLLPAVVARVTSIWRAGLPRGDRFAIAYFAATFLFFTLAGSRRSYYLLPVLPAAALLVARLLTTASSGQSVMTRRLVTLGLLLATVVLLLAGVVLLPAARLLPERWNSLPSLPAPFAFALGWVCCLALAAWAWRRLQASRVAVVFGTIAVLSMGYLHLVALPAVEAYRGDKAFAERVRYRIGGDLTGLALYQTRQPVFYLASPRPIREFDSPDMLRNAAGSHAIRWVIGRARDLSAIGPGRAVIDCEPTYAWEDATARGNKLQLVRLECAAVEP